MNRIDLSADIDLGWASGMTRVECLDFIVQHNQSTPHAFYDTLAKVIHNNYAVLETYYQARLRKQAVPVKGEER